jgi:hypothetical protein
MISPRISNDDLLTRADIRAHRGQEDDNDRNKTYRALSDETRELIFRYRKNREVWETSGEGLNRRNAEVDAVGLRYAIQQHLDYDVLKSLLDCNAVIDDLEDHERQIESESVSADNASAVDEENRSAFSQFNDSTMSAISTLASLLWLVLSNKESSASITLL